MPVSANLPPPLSGKIIWTGYPLTLTKGTLHSVSWTDLLALEIKTPIAVPLPYLYSRETHAHLYQEVCAEMDIAALFIEAEMI